MYTHADTHTKYKHAPESCCAQATASWTLPVTSSDCSGAHIHANTGIRANYASIRTEFSLLLEQTIAHERIERIGHARRSYTRRHKQHTLASTFSSAHALFLPCSRCTLPKRPQVAHTTHMPAKRTCCRQSMLFGAHHVAHRAQPASVRSCNAPLYPPRGPHMPYIT
jgi:hypothetical protein